MNGRDLFKHLAGLAAASAIPFKVLMGKAPLVTDVATKSYITVITNLDNSGPGSLREALNNDNAAGSWIRFAEGLSGEMKYESPLPTPGPDTTIDGRGARVVFNADRGPIFEEGKNVQTKI